MCNSKKCNPFEGLEGAFSATPTVKNQEVFNTLAQLGTFEDFNPDLGLKKQTTVQDEKSLYKRAKRKYLQLSLCMGLINFIDRIEAKIKAKAKEVDPNFEEDSRLDVVDLFSDICLARITGYEVSTIRLYLENRKHFWNMYHCARDVVVDAQEGTVKAKYCKSRLCIVCNSIRQAQMIKNYEPVFKSWHSSQFLTLTSQSVSSEGLRTRINLMAKVFTRLKNRFRQREKTQLRNLKKSGASSDEIQNFKDSCFMGVRSLEANFNPHTKNFNPHYHLIIRHKKHALELKEDWVTELSKVGIYVEPVAQHLTDAKEGSVMEIFKYFTKLATNVPEDKRKEGEPTKAIYIEGVLGVFNAFKSLRAFQNFGFKLSDYAEEPEPEPEEEEPEQAPSNTTGVELNSGIYRFHGSLGDWFLFDSRKMNFNFDIQLTGHKPSESLSKIAKNIIYET